MLMTADRREPLCSDPPLSCHRFADSRRSQRVAGGHEHVGIERCSICILCAGGLYDIYLRSGIKEQPEAIDHRCFW